MKITSLLSKVEMLDCHMRLWLLHNYGSAIHLDVLKRNVLSWGNQKTLGLCTINIASRGRGEGILETKKSKSE